MSANDELLASLLAPIPGDNPSGKDLRYDPRYDKVKEARREDLDLPAGGLATERKVADWPQVVKLATELLTKETKDLQLAAWFTEAMLKRDGAPGLTTGLALLKGLLEQFWETLYPELDEDDLELRTGPLEWVGGRLDVAARQIPFASGITYLEYQLSRTIPTEQETEENDEKREMRADALAQGKRAPEDTDRAVIGTPKAFYKALVAGVDAAQQALDALEIEADQRFGRDAPSFTKLRAALEEMRRIGGAILAEKLITDPDPVADVSGDGLAVGAYAPPAGWTGEGTGGPLAPEPTSPADAAARVASAAKFLRQQDATNPAPYLMLRGLRWGELRATPGEVEPRLLEAPQTAIRSRLKALLLDEKWIELLEQCEQLMASPAGRGWLDLQRYVLTACDRVGGPYDAVAAAIRGELRTLLAALPRLPEMTLMDDTPTANSETRGWLASSGLNGARADGTADDGEDTELGDGTEALDMALAEDDETAENGGLSRMPTGRRRPRTPNAPSRDPFALARAELAANRPNRAVELLVTEVARERSPRGRFVRQTQIAFVMVEAGLEAVARPILERLVAEIDERKLEEWEAGPLVAQPLALLVRVIDKLEDSDAEDQRRELYLRVCRLDPLQAMALQRRPA